MLKEDVKKIMQEHLMFNNDEAQEALDFMLALIDAEIQSTVTNEPGASNHIQSLNIAYATISDLINPIYED